MEISKEQKEAIEYLEKYTKWETYGERNLEKDIITTLNLIEKLQKENKGLKILKSGVQTLQNLGIEDGKYIVTSKTDFLNGSCKHVLDDYISKQEIKDKIKELDERIKNPERNSYWASYTVSECIGIRRILHDLLEGSREDE